LLMQQLAPVSMHMALSLKNFSNFKLVDCVECHAVR
jgi:hypothetical protein